MFVRSENCKYIVDNNDMYNQCKECGSVLAADDGPLGGGGGKGSEEPPWSSVYLQPDQKYQPSLRADCEMRNVLRNVKVIFTLKTSYCFVLFLDMDFVPLLS